ncbi:tRNA lysidine(34) synthetase TilS [Bartonella sp. B41]
MLVRLAANIFKISDFVQCKKLILAVSGGGDSLALLFLVRDYLTTLSIPPEIIVVTVDHQLRKESACEAENVAKICRSHKIKHVIVRWEGEKPKTQIAEKARIARYNLLFKEAQKHGATLIMTGHTLNDQVETYQMRCQRVQRSMSVLPQGIHYGHFDAVGCSADMEEKSCGLVYQRGLSCIPREALLRRTVRLIRPLLSVRRETLRSYLILQGKTWIDDPTNEDSNFERVRVRKSLPQKKFTEIAGKVDKAALKRREQAKNIANLILELDIRVEYGCCFIENPVQSLHKHPDFLFVIGLFAVLMGGSSYLLPNKKLMTIGQKLCLNSAQKQCFTLAGSVIEYNQNRIAVWRESRNIQELVIDAGKTSLWDGRYQITNYGVDMIKVGAADLGYLKFLLKNGIFSLERPHFPSLRSLPMVSSDKGTNIPEFSCQDMFQQNIFIKRIMAPFDWLLSCEDAVFINVIEPFFNTEVKR